MPNYDYFEEILLADSLVQLQPKTCWIYVASRDLQINGDLGSGNITALHKPSGTILTLDMFPHLIKNVQQPAGTSAKQDGSEPPRYGGTVLGGSVAGTRAGPVDGLHPEDVILHEYTRNVQQTYSRSAKRILRDWNERFPALAAPLTQALRENPVRVVDDGTHGDYGDLCPTVADFGLGPDINCGYLLGSGGQVDVFNMHVTLDFPSPQVRFPQGAELHGLVQFTVGHQALLQHRWKCVTRLVRPVELCAPREREEHAARMRRRRGHGEVTRRQQHGAARRHGRRHQRSRNHDLGSDHESDGGVVDHRMMNINTSEDLDLDTENDDGYDKDDRLDTTVRNSIITEHSSEICIQYRHKHDCAYMRSHQQQSGTSGLTMLVKGSCDCIATPLPDIRVPFPANEWVTMLSNLTYLVDLEQPGGSAGDGMEPSEPKPGSTSQQQSQTPVRRSARRSTAASTTTRNNSSAVTPPTKKAANANSTEPRASDLMGRIAMYQELWSLAPGSSSADAEDDVAGQQQSLLSPGSMSVPGGWTRRAAIAWTFAPNYKWMHDAKTNKPEFQASVPDTKWRHMTALDPSDRAHQQRMYAPRKGAGGGVPSDVGVAGHGGFESPTLGTPTLDGGSSMAHQGLIALDSHNYAHRHHVLSALSPAASSISAGDGGKFEPFLTGGAADSGSVDSPSLASSPWDSMAPGFGLLAAATTASMRQPVKGPNSHFSSVHQHHHHQAHHPHMFCHHATLGISGPRSSSAGRGHGQSAFAHGLATPPLGTPLPADFLGAVDGVPHQPHQHQHPTAGASTSNPTSSVDPALEHWSAMVGLTQAAANGEDSSGLATWASAGPGAGSVTSARAVTAAALTCTPTVDAVTKTATDLAAATAAKATRGTKRAYDDGGCGAISGYGDEDEDWGCRYRDQQRQDRHHDEQQFLRLQTDGPWVEGM